MALRIRQAGTRQVLVGKAKLLIYPVPIHSCRSSEEGYTRMNRHDEAKSFRRRDFFRLGGAGRAGAALLGTATPAHAAGSYSSNEFSSGSGGLRITRQKWGSVANQPVYLYTLSNGPHMTDEGGHRPMSQSGTSCAAWISSGRLR
jgi:hypothetical protein